MPADIAHEKEQAVVGVSGEIDDVAADHRHRFPEVGDVDVFDLWHATRDHHALNLLRALIVGAHDRVLFA